MNRLHPNTLLPTPEAARYACCQPATLRKHATPARRRKTGKAGRPTNLWRVSDLDRIRNTVARLHRKQGGEA